MNIHTETINGADIAVIDENPPLIENEQDALDFMMTVYHETGCNRMIIRKDALTEDFFVLSTGLAGKLLQKFVNYRCKLAVVGDFSAYTSGALRDFIRECNRGSDIFFVSSRQEALEKLSASG